ncbi:unnamed protein product, partial [Laminaria digitata]
TEQAALINGFAWHTRDAFIPGSTLIPRMSFVPTPGLKERTDYLNVQVKSRAQMLGQLAIDELQRETAPAAAHNRSQDGADAQFEAQIERAEQRMAEARQRLTPAIRQGYSDIDSYSVRVPAGLSAEAVAEALMRTGDYEYVSMDWRCYPTDTLPNDPLLSQQWYHASDR